MFPMIIKNLKIKGLPCSLVLIPSLPLTHYGTLNKSLPLTGPQFPHQFLKKQEQNQKSLRVSDLSHRSVVKRKEHWP